MLKHYVIKEICMIDDGRGRYKRRGRLETTVSPEEFAAGMRRGPFHSHEQRGFVVLLYYSGVRTCEILRAVPKHFSFAEGYVYWSVGKRVKKGIVTSSLRFKWNLPFFDEVFWCLDKAKDSPDERVWQFNGKTAWNIVNRVFNAYPHWFRMNRITSFMEDGYGLGSLRSWTGLTPAALGHYTAKVDVRKMSESLK
jgi:integrase